jgi:hypothetical protein
LLLDVGRRERNLKYHVQFVFFTIFKQQNKFLHSPSSACKITDSKGAKRKRTILIAV